MAECLVPKWESDELSSTSPAPVNPASTASSPMACRTARRFSILPTAMVCLSVTRTPAGSLPPEPLDIWRREIRELRAPADLRDRIAAGDPRGRDMLERRLGANLARFPFHLTASRGNGAGFRIRYRPPDLRAALWQRLVGEVASLIRCARRSAPGCARWLLKGDGSRRDRLLCSDPCRIRAFRYRENTH